MHEPIITRVYVNLPRLATEEGHNKKRKKKRKERKEIIYDKNGSLSSESSSGPAIHLVITSSNSKFRSASK